MNSEIALDHVGSHESLAPRLQLRPGILREAEQTTGGARRQLTGQRADDLDVATAAGLDRGQQLVDQRGDLRCATRDRLLREFGLNQHSLLTVPRIVLGDHVLHDVRVSRHRPQIVFLIAIDGLVCTHPRPYVVRIALIQRRVQKVYL